MVASEGAPGKEGSPAEPEIGAVVPEVLIGSIWSVRERPLRSWDSWEPEPEPEPEPELEPEEESAETGAGAVGGVTGVGPVAEVPWPPPVAPPVAGRASGSVDWVL